MGLSAYISGLIRENEKLSDALVDLRQENQQLKRGFCHRCAVAPVSLKQPAACKSKSVHKDERLMQLIDDMIHSSGQPDYLKW